MDQSLSKDNNWRALAAWLHLDVRHLEGLPNAATMMMSMVYNKHAEHGGEYIQRALEEINSALSTGKLGNSFREAEVIVREILEESPPLPPDGHVPFREPTETTWPLSPIEINEYRYSPFGYQTLQSGPYASTSVVDTSRAVQVDFNPNMDLLGAVGGHQPRTLVTSDPPRLVRSSSPTEQVWHMEENNASERGDVHSQEEANPNELVPRGPTEEQLRRKSSGYATIQDINPNRAPVKTPELHYDQPYVHHFTATSSHVAAVGNHIGDSSYDGVNMIDNPLGSMGDGGGEITDLDLSQGISLSELQLEDRRPEPPYQNVVSGTKPKAKGYLYGVPHSKKQHKKD